MSLRSQISVEGFAVIPEVLSAAHCLSIDAHLADRPPAGAGTRNLLGESWCAEVANELRNAPDLAPVLADMVAVQCTLFDKTPDANWLVPIHQDLSIPVGTRVEGEGLRGWSEKEGVTFVQPPTPILERLVAIRLHLDDSDSLNGPLRVVPGSHRFGRLPNLEQAIFRERSGEVLCTAFRGGVVAMKPLLLHASSKATSSKPRRVLHYLYGPRVLPHGLCWASAA